MRGKTGVLIFGFLAGVLFTAGVAWWTYVIMVLPKFSPQILQQQVEAKLTEMVGAQVEVGSTQMNLGRGSILAASFTLGSPTQPWLTADKIEVFGQNGVIGLRSGQVKGIVLSQPRLYLEQEAQGWNLERLWAGETQSASWSFLAGKDGKAFPLVQIERGQVFVRQPSGPDQLVLKLRQATWIPVDLHQNQPKQNFLRAEGLVLDWQSAWPIPFSQRLAGLEGQTAHEKVDPASAVQSATGTLPFVQIKDLTLTINGAQWMMHIDRFNLDLSSQTQGYQASLTAQPQTPGNFQVTWDKRNSLAFQWQGTCNLAPLSSVLSWSAQLQLSNLKQAGEFMKEAPVFQALCSQIHGFDGVGQVGFKHPVQLQAQGNLQNETGRKLPVIVQYDQKKKPEFVELQLDNFLSPLPEVTKLAGSHLNWLRGIPGQVTLQRTRINWPLSQGGWQWSTSGQVGIPMIRHPGVGTIKQFNADVTIRADGGNLQLSTEKFNCAQITGEAGFVLDDVSGNCSAATAGNVWSITGTLAAQKTSWTEALQTQGFASSFVVEQNPPGQVVMTRVCARAKKLNHRRLGQFNEVSIDFSGNPLETTPRLAGLVHIGSALPRGWDRPLENVWLKDARCGWSKGNHWEKNLTANGKFSVSYGIAMPWGEFDWSAGLLGFRAQMDQVDPQQWGLGLPGLWDLQAQGTWSPEGASGAVVTATCGSLAWNLPVGGDAETVKIGPGTATANFDVVLRGAGAYRLSGINASWDKLTITAGELESAAGQGLLNQVCFQSPINCLKPLIKALGISTSSSVDQMKLMLNGNLQWDAGKPAWSFQATHIAIGLPGQEAFKGQGEVRGTVLTPFGWSEAQLLDSEIDLRRLTSNDWIAGNLVMLGKFSPAKTQPQLSKDRFWFENLPFESEASLECRKVNWAPPGQGPDLEATSGKITFRSNPTHWKMTGNLAGQGFRLTQFQLGESSNPQTREVIYLCSKAHAFQWDLEREGENPIQVKSFAGSIHPEHGLLLEAHGTVRDVGKKCWEPELDLTYQLNSPQKVQLLRHLFGSGQAIWTGKLTAHGEGKALLTGALAAQKETPLNLFTDTLDPGLCHISSELENPGAISHIQLIGAYGKLPWREELDTYYEKRPPLEKSDWAAGFYPVAKLIRDARGSQRTGFQVFAKELRVNEDVFESCGGQLAYDDKTLVFESFCGNLRNTWLDAEGYLVFHPKGQCYRFGAHAPKVDLSAFFKQEELPNLPKAIMEPLTEMEIRLETPQPGWELEQDYIISLAPVKQSVKAVWDILRTVVPLPLGKEMPLADTTSIGLRRTGNGPMRAFYPNLEALDEKLKGQ